MGYGKYDNYVDKRRMSIAVDTIKKSRKLSNFNHSILVG